MPTIREGTMTARNDARAASNAFHPAPGPMPARGTAIAGSIAAALAIAVGVPAAEAAAAAPHAGWGSRVATAAAPGPMRTADVLTPDGDMATLPRLGTLCLRDDAGNDVVVMGRMTDAAIYTRLLVTFSGDAPVAVRYGVSRDGTDYRTVLDADYRTEASRQDDYVISLAVDGMKVFSDVCSR